MTCLLSLSVCKCTHNDEVFFNAVLILKNLMLPNSNYSWFKAAS